MNDAVESIRGQLAKLSAGEAPRDWAGLQLQLGNALMAAKDAGPLETNAREAAQAYSAALESCALDQDPDIWAQATAGLASALFRIGLAPNGPRANLGRATLLLQDAVAKYPRKRNPLYSATLESRLAQVLMARAEGWNDLPSGRAARVTLANALAALYSAAEICNEVMYPDHWEKLRKMIESAKRELNEIDAEISRMAGKLENQRGQTPSK